MKNLAFLALSLTACCWAGSVVAQTCSADAVSTFSAPGTVTGNTCPGGAAASTAVSTVCGTPLNGAGEVVYALTLGATNSASFSLQSTGSGATSACNPTTNNCPFEPGLFVLNSTPATGTCGTQACLVNQQAISQGATVSGSLAANKTAGTYYIVVGDTGSDNLSNPGCGPYSLTVSGTLPVKLQKFSVK
ncbi:MAG: hypothetical protein ACYC7G_06595 [Rudaea sp.]